MPSELAPTSPFDRRQFLVFGGLSVTLAAVLVACSQEDGAIPVSGEVVRPETLTQPPVNNAVYLRTSSSIIHNAIESYGALLDLDVLGDEDADLIRLIHDHHEAHARLLADATEAEGGEAYDEPNSAITAGIVEPALAEIDESGRDPQDVLRYVNAFEVLIGATLQGFTPLLTDAQPRELLMRIAAVDNRCSAVVTSRIEGFTIFNQEVIDAALAAEATGESTTTTTTTTVAPGGTEAVVPVTPLPVAQVPSSFASLAAVDVVLGEEEFTWQTPGPNSYIYE